MDLLIVILIVVAVLVVAGVGFVVSRGRGAPEAPAGEPAVAPPEAADVDVAIEPEATAPVEEAVLEAPVTFVSRLGKARSALSGYLGSIRSRSVDAQTWDELEEALILADLGVETTTRVLDDVREQARVDGVTDPSVAIEMVKSRLKDELGGRDVSLDANGSPAVWLFVGVNGVGKTTTIGKLGAREVGAGRTVVMAAGDTFRAAAGEQLELWADRSGAQIVRGAEGADPSSVIFDGIAHAAAIGADLVMADTAGRLHTKSNLMEELRKVKRVAEKGEGVVAEVLLVLDATTGQNGLIQARQFTEAVDVTGVVLTKLDGSAKGGIVMAIQSDLGIPVKLVGLGEGAHDLIEFDADQFVEALFETV
ncbi:MAG: signal recognition particle-docking protein FtsY [Acidimicrobiia bacterium]|nr:signal recognition particle-docking protein FtsY [Acidimicrobiia bacterium]